MCEAEQEKYKNILKVTMSTEKNHMLYCSYFSIVF